MAKKIRSKIWEDLVPVQDSYNELADLLLDTGTPEFVGSFTDFVMDIFSLSFPDSDFDTWHIHKICHTIDSLLNDEHNKYLLGVMPRYHLKSTLLGYASSIYRMLTSSGEGLYTSYKEELAGVHLFHIKEIISRNEKLNAVMKDLSPQSDSMVNYKVGNKRSKIYPSGIMGVKRGLHTDVICVNDDLMGDLHNPMSFTEIEKTIRIFEAELMNIPNKKCPTIVFGTVISDQDLLFHLKDKEKFQKYMIWMPAVNPDENHDVLWEKMFPKEWLDNKKIDIGWKAFSTEFLLIPVLSLEAFFKKEQLDKITNRSLINYTVPGF